MIDWSKYADYEKFAGDLLVSRLSMKDILLHKDGEKVMKVAYCTDDDMFYFKDEGKWINSREVQMKKIIERIREIIIDSEIIIESIEEASKRIMRDKKEVESTDEITSSFRNAIIYAEGMRAAYEYILNKLNNTTEDEEDEQE